MALYELLPAYLNHLAGERGLAELTLKNYQRILQQSIEQLREVGVTDAEQLRTEHLERLMMRWRQNGLSSRSIALYLAAWRTFTHYLVRKQLISQDPAAALTAPKAAKRLPKNLDVDSIAHLLKLPTDDPLAIRDAAIMELLYASGIRLAELVGLNIDDIHARYHELRVTGKGNKTRIVPYGSYAAAALERWFTVRETWLTKDPVELALFVTKRQQRMSARAVQQRLNFWGKQQGVPGNLYPHKLRHSFASHMLESSGDLRAVQELLGHANLSTTQVYTHLDFAHLSRVYDDAHPRARKKK